MSSRSAIVLGIAVVLLLSSGLGVALATSGLSAPDSTATEHQDGPAVHVSASAQVSAPPDTALVRLAVVATGDTAETARSRVAENASRMRAALREIGVRDEQVRTAYYDISAVYESTKDGARIVGYRAVHGFEVEVGVSSGDTGNRTGTVIDTAIRNGANQIDEVQFTLSEEARREVRKRALERAMENAREDADVVAAAGNLTITGVESISTADVGVSPVDVGFRQTAAEAETVIEPGPVTVSATVSVTYGAA